MFYISSNGELLILQESSNRVSKKRMPNEPVGVAGFDSKSDFYVGLEILMAGLQKEKEGGWRDSPLVVCRSWNLDESVILVRGSRARNFDRFDSGLAHRVRSVQKRRLFFEKAHCETKMRLAPFFIYEHKHAGHAVAK